ncbi:MAG: transposase [Candidatus Altiarchaeales archaeon]|nr:transposase [Candidatus Altiarchaeales archaeon]
MTKAKDRELSKVFRVEVLKPLNLTWDEFGGLLRRTQYHAAHLANEVITTQYLLAKGKLERNGSFCALVAHACHDCSLHADVKCTVCKWARDKFKADARRILRADISLPSYKNNLCMIKNRSVKLRETPDGWAARLAILPKADGKNQVQPEVLLRTEEMKRRSPGAYQVLERIASKEYKQGTTQVKRDTRTGKIYLLISYSFRPERESGLEASRVMGVDLGVSTPAYCAFNDSLKRKSLLIEGRKLLKTKWQIEGRRRDIRRHNDQRDLRRGHGKEAKFRPMEAVEQHWVDFRQSWNHVLARRIIEYALSNHAGAIHLEDLSPGTNSKFLGRNWPVAELLDYIEYKAKERGIAVKRVNPFKTSQTCSDCGAIKESFTFGDRKKAGFPDFVCDACGFRTHADYNAARNIAKAP